MKGAIMKGRVFLWLPLAVIIGLVGVFGLVLGQKKQPDILRITGEIVIDRPMPPLSLPRLEGGELVTADMLPQPGKVTIVNFFASWCQPCLIEHAEMTALAAHPNIHLVGIAWHDKPDAARQWLARQGNPYDVTVIDTKGESGIQWGLSGVPETFVLDAGGRLRGHIIGRLTPVTRTQQVIPLVEELLKK